MTVTSLPGFGIQDATQPWSITAPDPSTLEFTLKSSDHWAADYNNSVEQRDEIYQSLSIQPNTPISISYGFTVESGVSTADWVAVGQMHSVSEGLPPFMVWLQAGNHMTISAAYGEGTQGRVLD